MDIGAIKAALAQQITTFSGLRCEPSPRDQINPPTAVLLLQSVNYGATMSSTETAVVLRVLILVSDAMPLDKTQIYEYLGIGGNDLLSIAGAVQFDPSLNGTVDYAVPMTASAPRRMEYAGVTYMGAYVDIQVGAG